ncbi:alpha-B-crystallin [Sarcoptes scabiei]|nr:alpha-B-crystallin [Sarcoptes scabiei]
MKWDDIVEEQPYIDRNVLDGNGQKVHIKTYGCQMNLNDTEIASSILEQYNYNLVDEIDQAEIILLMTCAIRENAENKVWDKLRKFSKQKKSGKLKKFGLLGCMAERLKSKVLDSIPNIDIVAGPDSYRFLPKLLAINSITGQSAINVLLSIDETYDGVMPKSSSKLSSLISITRGCNNMCSYCIVPYTRGQERSRSMDSILKEVECKIREGAKEIVLLGQNVNSYRDFKENSEQRAAPSLADGFRTIYKLKSGGIGFDVLLDQVAKIDPNVRIRFTSPHPKDFNDDVIDVIAKHSNIAKGLHLPAQSGSNRVLERMRRGYTKEAYLNLVKKIRERIPDCAINSDFICGFCGETDNDHRETLDLITKVGYLISYIFAYSMRDKTYAYHHLKDDVPEEIKIKRLIELNELYRRESFRLNQAMIGQEQLILLEGVSSKSTNDLYGRNEANQKVIVPKRFKRTDNDLNASENDFHYDVGDFVVVRIYDSTPITLLGKPIRSSTIQEFYK